MDIHPAAGVLREKGFPRHQGVFTGAGALGIDGHIDEVRHPLRQGGGVELVEHQGRQLGVGGDPGRGDQLPVEILGLEIHAVLVLLIVHHDGKGQHLDAQLPLERGGDIRRGISDKFDTGHAILH